MIPDRRPKAPKDYAKFWHSGDLYTRTDVHVEYYACDCLKVILRMVDQLMHYEKLQKEDVIALITNDINRHFIEEDLT